VEQAARALLAATQALLQRVQLEIRVMLDQLVQTETPEQPGIPVAQGTPEPQAQMAAPEQLVLQGPEQPLEMLEVRARLGPQETPGPSVLPVRELHLALLGTPEPQGQTAIPGPPGLPGLGLRPEPQATPEARPRQPTQMRPL